MINIDNKLLKYLYFTNNHYFITKHFVKINQIKSKRNANFFAYVPFKFNNFKNMYLFKERNFKGNLFMFCSFSYGKVFMKVGLGFRKKYNRKNSIILLNVVRRKIVFFKPPINSFFTMVRRRSLYVFSSTKRKLFYYIIKFKYMRIETDYKYKGIFTTIRIRMYKRITKTILFARRIKFRRFKLKLNKKQKLKK